MIAEYVLTLAGLLVTAILAAGLLRRLALPYTVLLVVVGLLLGAVAGDTEAFHALHLTPDLVFFVFLPALIFESGYNLDARQLVRLLVPVLLLAVPALLISTVIVGTALWLALGLEPGLALLFGALISATDPVAVIALFRELGAPARLTVLVEGESLLNDASAIVVFGIVLGIVQMGTPVAPTLALEAGLTFLWVFLGGAVVGVLAAAILSELAFRLRVESTQQLALSLVLAYGTFILAEHVLHVSGVMAVVGAAVTLSAFGVTRLPQRTGVMIGETWELIAFVCNSLLFLLIGLAVNPTGLLDSLGAIGVAIVAMLVARAASVHGLLPVTLAAFALPGVSRAERHVMWWGGLKGGLAIAIVLSLPDDLAGRQLLVDLTLGVVLFTLLINAPTIRPLMDRLGLTKLREQEIVELDEAVVRARSEADRMLDEFAAADVISGATAHRVGGRIAATLEAGARPIPAAARQRHAWLEALHDEIGVLQSLREVGLVSQYSYLDMLAGMRALQDRFDGEIQVDGETADADDVETSGPLQQLELAGLRWLREQDRAAPLLARWQNFRLAQSLQREIATVLICRRMLDRLQRLDHGDAAPPAALAADYRQRLQTARARLESVQQDFPEFYRRFEVRFASRVALLSALASALDAREHGLLGEKGFRSLEGGIEAAIDDLPPIWEPLPVLSTEQLIDLVPLWRGLAPEAQQALAATARPLAILPGDDIIVEGEHGDSLYVIIRGRVEVLRGLESSRLAVLGEGEFFGEAALLGDQVRGATVRALIATSLLRLTRSDVRSLTRRFPEIERRLEAVDRVRQAG